MTNDILPLFLQSLIGPGSCVQVTCGPMTGLNFTKFRLDHITIYLIFSQNSLFGRAAGAEVAALRRIRRAGHIALMQAMRRGEDDG